MPSLTAGPSAGPLRYKALVRKVFCIGFHKTGTTSMHRALDHLGYRVCGVRKDLEHSVASGDLGRLFEVVDRFDAFEDNPWPLVFRELDAAYPGSRFVLTRRDVRDWFASVVNHFGAVSRPMRELIYGPGAGAPLGHEAAYVARHLRHIEEVRAWFAGRDDLLELDLGAGDGWEKLCRFLELPPPHGAFPHSNRRR